MAYPLRMNWAERKSKADDLIAFLSAFGVSRGDAEAIIGHAQSQIKELTMDQYIASGKGMAAFTQMFGKEGAN